MSLSQGNQPVADYAIDFRTQACLSDWISAAQCDTFLNGLAPYIKDELISFDLPPSFDGLIELTSRMDSRIQARRGSGGLRGSPAVPNLLAETATRGAEPMQMGRTSLMLEEWE